jgi:hypothetical protein
VSTLRTTTGGRAEARARLQVATKYLEVAELAASDSGQAVNNVVVGIAVLAGIAAADSLCLVAVGARYSGTDHSEAVKLLRGVDADLANELAKLIRLKPPAHYGHSFINEADRAKSLRAARKLVNAARAQ